MDKKRIVREGYNKIAEKYLKKRLEKSVKMDLVVEFSSMIKLGGRILDAGCGAGLPFTKYLSEYFEVIGIDISEKQIELAKKNAPNAQLLVKDMTELDFPENFFEGIFANYSIIHVPEEEHFDLFRNFYRMLKPNGIAMFSLHSTDDPGSLNPNFFEDKMFWSGYDAETNLRILQEIGFDIIWSKIVDDSLGEEGKHLFALIRKP